LGRDENDRKTGRGGSPGGFEALFHAHADAVLAYALRRSDPDTAQEVVSETFTVAWRRLSDIPDPALPWLLGVARRVLANDRRSYSRQRALALRLVQEPALAAGDATGDVDTRLSARAALELLPPAEREAIELLAWEGLSPSEGADVLGCSRGVFALRVHRARRRLRRHLTTGFEPMEPSSDSEGSSPPSTAAEATQTTTTREAR
jgi:RNA polymerase sigma-70 factor, ECF subfamily